MDARDNSGSGGSQTSVRKATSSDVPQLAAVLARAMHDDPVICWVIPRPATRRRVLPRFFAAMIRHLYLPTDEVYTTGAVDAAALWLPPGNTAPATSDVLRLASRVLLLLPMVGGALVRAPGMLRLLDTNHPKEPHYYLALIGTEPARQGHGIGAAMLSSQLAHCDAEGIPAYLESSNWRNVALYARHGFEVTKQLELAPTGPSMWLMWRSPKGCRQPVRYDPVMGFSPARTRREQPP
jgi:ribosomal protein S18 acetylase RimI-like enzyme